MSNITYFIDYSNDILFKNETPLNAREKALEHLYSLPKIEGKYATLRVGETNGANFYPIATNGNLKDFDFGHETLIKGLNFEYILYKRYRHDIGGSPLKLWSKSHGSEWDSKYLLPAIPQPLANYLETARNSYCILLEHELTVNQEELQFIKEGLFMYLKRLNNQLKEQDDFLKGEPFGSGAGFQGATQDEQVRNKIRELLYNFDEIDNNTIWCYFRENSYKLTT